MDVGWVSWNESEIVLIIIVYNPEIRIIHRRLEASHQKFKQHSIHKLRSTLDILHGTIVLAKGSIEFAALLHCCPVAVRPAHQAPFCVFDHCYCIVITAPTKKKQKKNPTKFFPCLFILYNQRSRVLCLCSDKPRPVLCIIFCLLFAALLAAKNRFFNICTTRRDSTAAEAEAADGALETTGYSLTQVPRRTTSL